MQLSDKQSVSDMRSAYGQTLVELGLNDENLVCVGADTTDSLKTKQFGDKFQNRLFNVGIAEANLVSLAAGLAIAGKTVFASTYAAFLPGRCLDQIRNAICYPYLNVKLVVSHAGLTVGPDGASHQQIEDISTMRTIPNMRVLVPADANSVKNLLPIMAKNAGPFYMRLARPSNINIYEDNFQLFEIGKGNVIKEGSDATIIACGLMVQEGIQASDILKKEYSISCKVIDMYSIKPLDIDLICSSASETGAIITIEEHNIIGGLGSAVCEVTAENCPVPVKRVGVMDTFGESARDEELGQLLSKYGLKSDHIVESVIKTRRKLRK
jgi:transketolase